MEATETTTKTKWSIDSDHSEIGFKVKHLMISKVRGRFDKYGANISTTKENFSTVEIDFWLNAESINTGEVRRDVHLRSADFFDVENYKEIRFKSEKMSRRKGIHYVLSGDLTMKGINKKIELEVEFGGIVKDPWGNYKAVFIISGKINRKDWGLNWNAALETGGVLVSEDVWIDCQIQLTKQS